MCGIAGIFDAEKNITERKLLNMAKSMIHRGPNSTGFFIKKSKDFGLVHNRLSIIDLSKNANQPMSNENDSIWLVFNGEIYNFGTLRQKLLKNGHKFRSNSDSEVILHLYEEKGIKFLEDLNGMFAFCLYDECTNNFILARDRVGIKPLYYYYKNGLFAFSSEIKALLSLPSISKELNYEALDFYFSLGYIPEDYSIFKDIKKLKPAHYLRFDRNEINIFQYWNLTSKKYKYDSYSTTDLVDLLEEKLRESINLRMVSDVPIGTFLSGGLDSSLISAIMAQESDNQISTFTIGFDSAKHNETSYARMVADHINSRHTEYFVKIDAIEALEKLMNHFDEPFADSSLIPTYYVSKIAKKDVTVILSGDGGDELFGGYNWYSWVLSLNKTKSKLGPCSYPISALSKLLPAYFKGKNFLSSLRLSPFSQFLKRVSIFTPEEKKLLYRDNLKEELLKSNPIDNLEKYFKEIDGDILTKMTLTDFHYYLPEDILTKVDRASMAVSLETRVPWLDHRLVEFAFSLPSEQRINGNTKKYIIKKLAQKLLPNDFPLERKQGFCMPTAIWMAGKLGDMLEQALEEKHLDEFFNLGYIKKMLGEHKRLSNARLHGKLFSVLILSLWYKRYIT